MEQSRIKELRPLRKAVEAIRNAQAEDYLSRCLAVKYADRGYIEQARIWQRKKREAIARFCKDWERIYGFAYDHDHARECEARIPKAEFNYLKTGLC